MIISDLNCAKQLRGVNSLFEEAIKLLKKLKPFSKLKEGRYDGPKGIYAISAESEGRGQGDSLLETHINYIDLHLTVTGVEVIGWKPLSACKKVKKRYNRRKDVALFSDKPEMWLTLLPGRLAVFYPEDAHAPLAGTGKVKKIILKIPSLC